MEQDRETRATSFGAWADEYHRNRPGYPEAAVAWLLGDAQRVIELGAGTGRLTDRLVDRNLSLTVTEIDGRMLHLISERHPHLPLHQRGAANLPVADEDVDAVLVADAWQWFPKQEAVSEVKRVLRPGGWLACIWNDNAVSTPDWQWDAMRLSKDIAARIRRIPPIDRLELGEGVAEQATFPWTWQLTSSQFSDYVSTLSHIRTLPELECQEAVVSAERAAVEACSDTRSPTVDVALDAVCVRWHA